MFSSVNSFGLMGVDSYLVQVEVDTSRSLPSFEIVGLPDAVVKESRDRVRSSMRNCDLPFPKGKVVVNLAPAGSKKVGAVYDLPILLGILKCEGVLAHSLDGMGFVGELSLDGNIRPITGILPMALSAAALGLHTLFVPYENAAEAAAAKDVTVYPVENITQLLSHLRGESALSKATGQPGHTPTAQLPVDLCDVKGQTEAKRALEIAACGSHNLLFIGSPGSGKSMLAKRLPTILPGLLYEEAIETTIIHSIAGVLPKEVSLLSARPFRAPHHTISPAGLVGGGSNPKPGEISLAHNGVLFLDELPEFPRAATEVLRQPLEDGIVTISRAGARLSYPSNFMLVAAMNPCPCGFYGHPTKPCTCAPAAAQRYLAKISGPLLDRLDLHVEVSPVEYEHLQSKSPEETSATVRRRVEQVRKIQTERYKNESFHYNSAIPTGKLATYCPLTDAAGGLLKTAFERLSLSARAYDRILKMARTIADMDGCETIAPAHISEAIQYRGLDRKYWGSKS